MPIVRWNPWNISSFLDEDFELPTIPGLNSLSQGLNLYETNDAFIGELAVPGVPENNIDVSIDNGVVRVSAARSESNEEKTRQRNIMTTLASSYNYSFRLPKDVMADKEPEASLEDGVLTLKFPKTAPHQPKRIKVIRGKKEAGSQK